LTARRHQRLCVSTNTQLRPVCSAGLFADTHIPV